MNSSLDATHDPALSSWLLSANQAAADFTIQNLPHGVFRLRGSSETFRGGIAIGDQVFDLQAALSRGLFDTETAAAARMAGAAPLNAYMALPREQRRELRRAVSQLFAIGAKQQEETAACLIPQSSVEYGLPAQIGDFSDFYTSLHHATNVGALFRPDNPVLPNYRWLPVAYTGRTSSIRISGFDLIRPRGQLIESGSSIPRYAPCQRLDYEVELGIFVSQGNDLGSPIPVGEAENHLFGICLLNDWSARDIQAWEYQPLGPFLAKSFLTSISPWIVTMEALEPFRARFARPPSDPEPLPHLWDDSLAERGAIDIQVRMSIQTQRMQQASLGPMTLSTSRLQDAYWALAQLVAHQTSNGANLCPGDLIGSGTLSGPTSGSQGCLLELSSGGKKPIGLPNGETRTFLQDGDRVVMTGWCEAPGRPRIGFGECSTLVLPSAPTARD